MFGKFWYKRFSFYATIALCLILPACHPFCPGGLAPLSPLSAPNVRSEKLSYLGELPATAKGKASVTVKLKAATNASQLILFAGNLNFSGKLTPKKSGGSIPGTLRFQLKHKSASGGALSTINFDVAVQADGTIRVQKLPFNVNILATPKQSVEVAVIPLDKALAESNANLKIAYVAPPLFPEQANVNDDFEEAIVEAPDSEARKIQFTYVGLLPPAVRNVESGHFRFSSVRGPDDPLDGNLSIKGKLKSEDGTSLPRQLQLVVKHTNPAGGILRTEKFNMNVAADGGIPLQKFPVTTKNPKSIKESLQFSVVSVDRNFPFSSINVTITYTHT